MTKTSIRRYGGDRCRDLKLLLDSHAGLGGFGGRREDGAEVLL
jgi:hypothetical protein